MDYSYLHYCALLSIVLVLSPASQHFAAEQMISFIFFRPVLNKLCVYCGDSMFASFWSAVQV